ncbi:MAG: DMT family transporter [Candidatus Aenigmarchaeota archaeon]|nr:DMT family transporter [Candidatus Aenigmarchaeota archaeon]
MSGQSTAYLYAIPTILIWASVPVVIKSLQDSLNFLQIILFSTLFAAVFFFMLILKTGKIPLLRKYSMRDYFLLSGMGFLGAFLQFVFLYGAIFYSTAQEAFIINYLWPILVVLFAIPILKERLSAAKLLGLLLAFAGLLVIITRGTLQIQFTGLLGNVLALLTALVVSLYFVLNKKFNYEKYTSLFVYYLVSFIFSLVINLLFYPIPSLSLVQLATILWLGIFVNAMGYFFWFNALEKGDTAKISNLIYLTPFVSIVYIYFFLSEPILPSSVIGLLFIIGGIAVQQMRKASG